MLPLALPLQLTFVITEPTVVGITLARVAVKPAGQLLKSVTVTVYVPPVTESRLWVDTPFDQEYWYGEMPPDTDKITCPPFTLLQDGSVFTELTDITCGWLTDAT